ncbi:Glycine cleavage system H protein [Balamuthia mandrillaris]
MLRVFASRGLFTASSSGCSARVAPLASSRLLSRSGSQAGVRFFATQVPENLRYTKSHEWLRVEGDIGTVGITDHAQDALGEVVFVDLPKTGTDVSAGDSIVSVESVKTVSDVYAPVSGTIQEVNTILKDTESASLVNSSPYDKAWFVKIKLSKPEEVDQLLTPSQYKEVESH